MIVRFYFVVLTFVVSKNYTQQVKPDRGKFVAGSSIFNLYVIR